MPVAKARRSRLHPPLTAGYRKGECASEEVNMEEWRQRTSAGVSVGDRRSPSYTNLSDPTRVNVGRILVSGKCRGKRTGIFAEAFLKEGHYERVWFTRVK